MHLEVTAPTTADGVVTLAATLDRDRTVWFRVPEAHAADLTDSADPFVAAVLHHAMEKGRPLHVAGRVSPTLLYNLEEYTAISQATAPKFFRSVRITADEERESPPPTSPDEAIVAFSGGLDCSFTTWRHTQGHVERRRANLRAGVFVSGIDLERGPACARVADQNRRMLADFGLDFLPVETNLRDYPDYRHEACGAGVLAGMLLFQKRYGAALIASSAGYADLVFPAASTPITDRLFSTRSMRVVHDGAEFLRTRKTELIGGLPVLRRYLRVCARGPDLPRNCCRCEKCIRTILAFRILGHGLPECFAEDVTPDVIRSTRLERALEIMGYDHVLALAREQGVRDPCVTELGRAIRRFRRRERRHALKRVWRRLRGVERCE